MAGRGRQPWAQRLELVVQALLEHPAVADQPAPVANRADQRIHGAVGGWPAGALADQPDQRRAVTVIGLGAPPAKLGSGRLRLGGGKQPPPTLASAVPARPPGAWCSRPVASTPMVGAPATPLATIGPAKASTPSRSTGNDTGSPISPRSPLVSQTRLLTLPGSTATTSDVAGTVWRSSSTTSHLLTNRKGPLLGKSLTTKVAQELSAERGTTIVSRRSG
jgi:hypothetical protein